MGREIKLLFLDADFDEWVKPAGLDEIEPDAKVRVG